MPASQQDFDAWDQMGESTIPSSSSGKAAPTYQAPTQPTQQPNILHSLASIFQPGNTKLADTMYQGAANAGQDKSAKGNFPKAFSNAVSNMGNVAMQVPHAALDDALSKIPIKLGIGGAKAGGKAIQTGAQIARYPTKTMAANATTNAANKATAAGVTGDWGTLADFIKSKTETKLGMNPEIQKALKALTIEKNPETTNFSPPAMNPSELVQWRRQIAARGAGNGVFANLFKGSNIEDKVNSIARSAISDYLHTIAPQTRTGDKLYSLYSKGGRFGGDPKELLLKYGLGGGAAALGAPTLGGMIKGYMNSSN